MGIFKKVKGAAKKGLYAAVPGKGASVKGALGSKQVKGAYRALKRLPQPQPRAPRIPQEVKNLGKGFETLSGVRGVRRVTSKLNQLAKKNKKR